MKFFSSLFLFFLVLGQEFISAQTNIADARNYAVGATVTVTGIVTNGSELGAIRYIQDNTAGIGVYNSVANATLTAAVSGDAITVTGTLKNYNSLLEIDPVTTVILNSSGNTLPAATVVTPTMLGETYEAEIVQVNHCIFSSTGTFASNTNYSFTSNGETGQFRIVSTSPLIGQAIPTTLTIIKGILSQYTFTGSGGYQILARNSADLIADTNIYINSPVQVSNINTTGFSVAWTTNISGSSQIKYGLTNSLELGEITASGTSTSHTVNLSSATAGQIYYFKAFSVRNMDTAYSSIRVSATQSNSSGNIKVYFNRSTDHTVSTGTDAITLNQTIDDTLVNYINRSKYTLDIAIYNFIQTNLADIIGAINSAYSRGVAVRIVYDGSSTNSGFTTLNAGIGITSRPSGGGIMHNKFVVIDANSANPNDPLVWTGSTNWTEGQIFTDANNVIIIQDQSLAKAYRLEFEEMFGSTGLMPNSTNSKFGGSKADNTPHEFVIGGKRVECYFSPSDSVTSKIKTAINSADVELCVETNLITRDELAYAISDRKTAGVDAKTIVSSKGTCSAISVSVLVASLGNNFRDYNEGGILHHKLLIADPNTISSDPLVLTGSHNWSTSAETANDENIVIVHDATIANIYYQEFVKRFGLGVVITSINNVQKDNPISLYPNPGTGKFYFNLEKANSNPTMIKICDITGKNISELSPIKESTFTSFDISFLENGFYFCTVFEGNKILFEQKILLCK
jgi:phosphatidylserine/phosphatidylglycerophosphate/cardiolipin synthase-like enzyme